MVSSIFWVRLRKYPLTTCDDAIADCTASSYSLKVRRVERDLLDEVYDVFCTPDLRSRNFCSWNRLSLSADQVVQALPLYDIIQHYPVPFSAVASQEIGIGNFGYPKSIAQLETTHSRHTAFLASSWAR